MNPPESKPADSKAEDRELIQRIADGDTLALEELYDRYSGLLLGLARRVLNDPSDAEEVLQEAFLQVWKQAGRYDKQRSSVSTWLVLITRSRAIDRVRSRQVVQRTLDHLQQEKSKLHASPEGVRPVLMDQRRKRLDQEMEKLPNEQAEVLKLAFYSGLTQSEIAAKTGIPLGTVKTRTLLAMKKMRKALQAEIRELL